MFLSMLAGNCRGCTRTPSPPTGGEERGEAGRCFCPCWQGTAKAVQGHPHHLEEVRREGRQVDVSVHVGRELQRLYKDTLTTNRRYTLCVGQRERKVEVERGRQVDVSAHDGRELQRLYKNTLITYRRYSLW